MITPIIPIFRLYLSMTIDFSYFPWNDGSSESSMFATKIGDLVCSMNGTTPSTPLSNSWLPSACTSENHYFISSCIHFRLTHDGISRQHVQELAGNVPPSDCVPDSALEIIASVQVYWICIFSSVQQILDYGRCAGVAANTFFTRLAAQRSRIRLLEPTESFHINLPTFRGLLFA